MISFEAKRFSQHGEDGIIRHLCSKIQNPSRTYIEIGADWNECNSRNLIEQGWEGVVYDAKPNGGFPCYVQGIVTHKNIEVPFKHPDFFSLDIDSFDYFVADEMLRQGLRPEVVCLETNTFIPEDRTVIYKQPFARYVFQPAYGLYFGCSLGAWRYLWEGYGYVYVGMDSSYTNAFFVNWDDDASDDFGYQTYFCKKYGKSGEELSGTLDCYKLLDVKTKEYARAFEN